MPPAAGGTRGRSKLAGLGSLDGPGPPGHLTYADVRGVPDRQIGPQRASAVEEETRDPPCRPGSWGAFGDLLAGVRALSTDLSSFRPFQFFV
eukprot:CAMPEP_0198677964 /NCGR_PEP_ID=MMETSP1467-20131203/99681_1 /TAXON_ID=1462469 /ORGANISM="unid. sp., Strain CCMP2135" /LENGTH=91 /DNA_ID=CAMNT_0044414867 /DNA_START=91 /DNA_END=366 /DNA_ORIENTATION=-